MLAYNTWMSASNKPGTRIVGTQGRENSSCQNLNALLILIYGCMHGCKHYEFLIRPRPRMSMCLCGHLCRSAKAMNPNCKIRK